MTKQKTLIRAKHAQHYTSNNKGMMIEQLFVMLLAAVVFILIIIYGYKAINSFSAQTSKAEFVTFERHLQEEVQKKVDKFGSREPVQITLPKGHEWICIVDNTASSRTLNATINKTIRGRDLIIDTVSAGTPQNVFLIPPADYAIQLKHIKVQDNAQCYKVQNNKATIAIKGLGTTACIYTWGKAACT